MEIIFLIVSICFLFVVFVYWQIKQQVVLVVPVGESFRTAEDYNIYRQRVEKALSQFEKNKYYNKIIILSNEDLDPQRPLKPMTEFTRELIEKQSIPCDVILGVDPPSSVKWEMVKI